MKSHIVAGALAALFLGGCVSSPPEKFDDVRRAVAQRGQPEVYWVGHDAGQDKIDKAVAARLAQPISADDAVRIALLNNHDLQADLDGLGIARADVIAAGLLPNPMLSVVPRFPDKAPSGVDLEISVEADFIGILTMPARHKLAEMQYEQAKLKAAASVLDLASRTRIAFYRWQAAQQMLELRKTDLEAANAAAELSQRQRDAGNISDLELAGQQAMLQKARLDLNSAEAGLSDQREELNALMSLSDSQINWTAAGSLPETGADDLGNLDMESLALSQRIDLAAAKQQVLADAQALGVAKDVRFFPSGSIGFDTEKNPDGQTVTGPMLSIPLPLMDQGQATTLRAQARFEQSGQRYTALEAQIRSDIRRLGARMQSARARSEMIRATLLPLHQRLVDESLREYNGMLLGVFQLLQVRQNQINANQQYLESLRDYWIARAQLLAAVGGTFQERKQP
jgi:cobalt-zinc-cadmium efflux system outer membrane protein